jgi:TPR repeat protein
LILVAYYEKCSAHPLPEWQDLYLAAREAVAIPFFAGSFPRTRDEMRADCLLSKAETEARRIFIDGGYEVPSLERAKLLYSDKKYQEAFPLFLQLAHEGDPDAQGYVGSLYDMGFGVPKDHGAGTAWVLRAAKQGDAVAQWVMGHLYAHGHNVRLDYGKAVEWHMKAAEQNFARAQFALGYLSSKGKGIRKDLSKAAAWYRKAAEQGNEDAQYNLGCMYREGCGVSKDVSKAAEWFLLAAKKGLDIAQYRIAVMYKMGVGVAKNMREAAKWMRKAANQGYADAQCSLGLMYEHGLGVPRNSCKAAKWLRKAAQHGDAQAQYSLGRLYEKGRGVVQNDRKAKALFQKASDQGYEAAQKIMPPTPFQPPPVPGNAHIQPLTDDAMLWEEGKIMHHCVGGYGGSVRKGECYIYRVLQPARATLEIRPTDFPPVWMVSQVKGYCNAAPAPGVSEAVLAWLDEYICK